MAGEANNESLMDLGDLRDGPESKRILEAHFREYMRRGFPDPSVVSDVQRNEMAKCWFGGAAVVLKAALVMGEDTSEETIALIFNRMLKEIEEFGNSLDDNEGGLSDSPWVHHH